MLLNQAVERLDHREFVPAAFKLGWQAALEAVHTALDPDGPYFASSDRGVGMRDHELFLDDAVADMLASIDNENARKVSVTAFKLGWRRALEVVRIRAVEFDPDFKPVRIDSDKYL